MSLVEELSAIVGAAFERAELNASLGVVKPADRPDLAQFQCNGALAAAKIAKANPRKIAEDICASLGENPIFSDLSVAGPGFINITLTDSALSQRLMAVGKDESAMGVQPNAVSEKIILDYGGPNVAKPLHVGHLRAAIIGESLKRIFRFVGDKVVSDVHLGDWGLPMGQLITELEREQPNLPYFDANFVGSYPEASPVSLADLERLYPKASAACKADPARAEEARRATAELQQGRVGYKALWTHFVTVSRAGVEREYNDLGVSFDLWKGEADADPLISQMADALREKNLLVQSDGAEVIQVAQENDKKKIPPLMVFKSDGGVTYGTTDLATIIDRVQSEQPDRIVYVVDQRQALHFEQVFRAADLAGFFAADRLEHVGFGTMNGKDGKPFKTREGGVLKLRDLIDTITTRAAERLQEQGLAKDYDAAETEDIASKVGLAALKFADLSSPRLSDYIFDLDRFLAFEGKTGPYLLYASVRVRSVLAKAQEAGAGEVGALNIASSEERDLALSLLAFGDAVKEAYVRRAPHILCDHAFSIAQAFSKFYAACPIVGEQEAILRKSRLTLATLTGRQLDLIFHLLGFAAPARM